MGAKLLSLAGFEDFHQCLVFLAAFGAEGEMLFDLGDGFVHGLVRKLALGKFADVLQAFAAIELAVARQAEQLYDAANLFAGERLCF
jgi:hypothetical protein